MQIAFSCCMRGGEVAALQWDRFNGEGRTLYMDRVIDRVDKKLLEKLPKMEVLFRFPNLFPGTHTLIVLKQPKTEGSIRNAYVPEAVVKKLLVLRQMQEKLKLELGDDGYMDYGLIICQANGRPMMTEHLNKRFKEILVAMNDPEIDVDKYVFHSIRHTSASVKLKLSGGDIKAVQGDGGWSTPEMVTRRYAEILDEDRRALADKMETQFYHAEPTRSPAPASTDQLQQVQALLLQNPELLNLLLSSLQITNRS